MSPNVLSDYLQRAEQAVLQCPDAYVEHYLEESLTPERVNLRIRIRFNNGHLLEISEAIVVDGDDLEFLDYRYHHQDENNDLISRYDSTPHFPEISTFPHHKHLPDDVIASAKPDIEQVIREAATH